MSLTDTPEEESPIEPEDIQPEEEAGIIHIQRRHLYAALLPLAFVTGIATGYLFWGRGDLDSTPEPQLAGNIQPEPRRVRLDIDLDDDPSLGPSDAPITIVEFSDFNCPYCARFYEQTFTALLEAYPEQIHFVYRDLPVVGGFEAAQASECADDQGVYWEYHDLLFRGGLGTNRTALLEYSTILEMDVDAFEACLEEGKFAGEVEADARYASSLGITGTPTFFINGIPLVGAQPLSQFVSVIESELNPPQ
jgi:protein-disulfide isomerase